MIKVDDIDTNILSENGGNINDGIQYYIMKGKRLYNINANEFNVGNMPSIEYIDSVGTSPKKEFRDAIVDFAGDIYENLGMICIIKINKKQFQFGSSECGMFSLHFILRRAFGTSMEQYINESPDDNGVNAFRHLMFRNPNNATRLLDDKNVFAFKNNLRNKYLSLTRFYDEGKIKNI